MHPSFIRRLFGPTRIPGLNDADVRRTVENRRAGLFRTRALERAQNRRPAQSFDDDHRGPLHYQMDYGPDFVNPNIPEISGIFSETTKTSSITARTPSTSTRRLPSNVLGSNSAVLGASSSTRQRPGAGPSSG